MDARSPRSTALDPGRALDAVAARSGAAASIAAWGVRFTAARAARRPDALDALERSALVSADDARLIGVLAAEHLAAHLVPMPVPRFPLAAAPPQDVHAGALQWARCVSAGSVRERFERVAAQAREVAAGPVPMHLPDLERVARVLEHELLRRIAAYALTLAARSPGPGGAS